MPTFLSPAWGLLGLLAIPIIALYILRQKRPDLKVSSTLLWSKTLADMQASTPFQKLRRNLLMILQLIVLAAITLALMRAVIQSKASTSTAGVIIIDDTASMQAKDASPDKQTRLEYAKEEARKLVKNKNYGDKFMLIADSGGMDQVQCQFTSDKDELLATIDRIKPVDTTSDLSASVRVAVTYLRGVGGDKKAIIGDANVLPGRITLFSDGCGVHLPPDIPGLNDMLQYIKVGSSSENVGITRIEVVPLPKTTQTYDVFVSLVNSSEMPQTKSIGLAYGSPENFLHDRILEVTIPGRTVEGLGQVGVTFEKVVSPPGKIYVILDKNDDDFPLDNVGYALLEPARKPHVVLVSDSGEDVLDGFVRAASKAGMIDGQIISFQEYKHTNPADLYIFDRITPAQLPNSDILFVRPSASVGGFTVVGTLNNPPVLRWKRDSAIMAYAELGQLKVSRALKLTRDPDADEIVSSTEGPLVQSKDVGPSRRTIVAFDPDPNMVPAESNWGLDPSFLIFMQNILDQTRTRHFIGTPQLVTTGQSAHLFDLGESATVTSPDGVTRPLVARDGAAEFPYTNYAGFYAVKSGTHTATFAANLLSPVASDITPQSLQLATGGNVQEARSVATVNREIWQWLAMAGLLVLLGEWWVYHRRIA